MLEWFKCPDNTVIPYKDCLNKCRMEERCATTPYLRRISQEREWTGKPSTTQLLNGTMMEFLKLTQPYVVSPDKRAFMVSGTMHHESLEQMAKELGLPAEIALSVDRDIFDLLEPNDNGTWTLSDYKNWGSFKVAKALGIVQVGKKPHPTEVYKTSGKWGKAGDPKMIPVFQQMPQEADNWEAELQLNHYAIKIEELANIKISKMQVQATIRDGGLAVAESRGIFTNLKMIPIPRLDKDYVVGYFAKKEKDLLQALEHGSWSEPCNDKESWVNDSGTPVRCKDYCDVAMYCPKGILYQRE